MCDYANDCSNWRPLCREVTYERPNEPRCFDKVSLKAQAEPVDEVPCSVGLEGQTVRLDEVLEVINDYCVLHPTKEGSMFESGFYHAGKGVIEALKAKYLKAD